ncbi:glycosyltransferase family A protein [uncultured Erythrobacter sp.]|uniref:glycosyltransferase family 2 protein n=1 Tax=uncultured Erythrobacter sp. TaxID=263913 RepID=UPI0026254057|nr:glycosyltransferase family A protein [uncultured Erythrobacter sp.]
MKLLFHPIFQSPDELAQYVYRACWYLSPLAELIDRVTFLVDFDTSLSDLPDPPDYLSSHLKQASLEWDAIAIERCAGDGLEAYISQADFLFSHEEAKRADLIEMLREDQKMKVIRIDRRSVRYADSLFLRFTERVPDLLEGYRKIASSRAAKILPKFKKDTCYLFGTGPNFVNIAGWSFEDGLVVACNSIVANSEVMDQLNPDIFVLADPIFHAGPSSYAERFREKLCEQLDRRNCPLLVPQRDFHIYSHVLPERFQDRLIPIQFQAGEKIRFDLISEPVVTTTSNILTLFQLPLAGSLGQTIRIAGCDGRPIEQSSYFWSHNKTVQINDEMASIRLAHPAFFDISYNEYYQTHVETLRTWVDGLESSGKTIENLTPSYIPTLQSRQVPTLLAHLSSQLPEHRVSVIVPVYNGIEFLRECVESILSDACEGVHVILIDDFSTDGSFDLAQEIAENHPQISAFQNFHAKGVSGARNTGIDLASGDFIAFLDCDDILKPNSLKVRADFLTDNPGTHIVHSTVEFYSGEGGGALGVEIFPKRAITFKDMHGSGAHFNTLMFRASEVKGVLRFEEGLANGEDWLALARVLRRGFVSEFVEEGGAYYRVHSNSVVVSNINEHERKLEQALQYVYSPVDSTEEVACEYREGLSEPVLEDVKSARRLSQFIHNMLGGNIPVLQEALNDEQILAALRKAQSIDGAIRVPTIRTFERQLDKLDTADPARLDAARQGLLFVKRQPEFTALAALVEASFLGPVLITNSFEWRALSVATWMKAKWRGLLSSL